MDNIRGILVRNFQTVSGWIAQAHIPCRKVCYICKQDWPTVMRERGDGWVHAVEVQDPADGCHDKGLYDRYICDRCIERIDK